MTPLQQLKLYELKGWLTEDIVKGTGRACTIDAIAILHNYGQIILQFPGWAIVLKGDGTYYTEGTDGG